MRGEEGGGAVGVAVVAVAVAVAVVGDRVQVGEVGLGGGRLGSVVGCGSAGDGGVEGDKVHVEDEVAICGVG